MAQWKQYLLRGSRPLAVAPVFRYVSCNQWPVVVALLQSFGFRCVGRLCGEQEPYAPLRQNEKHCAFFVCTDRRYFRYFPLNRFFFSAGSSSRRFVCSKRGKTETAYICLQIDSYRSAYTNRILSKSHICSFFRSIHSFTLKDYGQTIKFN